MLFRWYILVLCALFLGSSSVSAKRKKKRLHKITKYLPKVGHSYRVRRITEETQKMGVRRRRPFRRVFKEIVQDYKETVLQVTKGMITRRKRVYRKCRVRVHLYLSGKPMKKKLRCPYEGKTVFITDTAKGWHFQYKNKKTLSASASRLLLQEFNKKKQQGAIFYIPSKPVKIGERWKLSIKTFLGAFAFPKDTFQLKGSYAVGFLKQVKKTKKSHEALIERHLFLRVKKFPKVKRVKGDFSIRLQSIIQPDGRSPKGDRLMQGRFVLRGVIKSPQGRKVLAVEMTFTQRDEIL